MSTTSPSLGTSSLGATIARKQKQRLEDGGDEKQLLVYLSAPKSQPSAKQELPSSSSSSLNAGRTYSKKSSKKSKQKQQEKKKRPQNASWMALVEGATLYGLCLVVPSVLGILISLDRIQLLEITNRVQIEICKRSAWICWHLFGRIEEEPKIQLTFDHFTAPDTHVSDFYVIVMLTLSIAFIRVLLVHFLVPNKLAPQQMEALVRCKSITLLSSDYKGSLTPTETPRKVIDFDEFVESKQGDGKSGDSLALPNLPHHGNSEWESPKKGDKSRTQKASSFSPSGSSDHDSTGDLVGLSMDTPLQNEKSTVQVDIAEMGSYLHSSLPIRGKKTDCEEVKRGYDTPPTSGSPTMTPQVLASQFFQESNQAITVDDENGFTWNHHGSTASLAAAATAALQEEGDDDSEHNDEGTSNFDRHDHRHDHRDANRLPNDAASPISSPPSPLKTRRRRPKRLFAAPRYATAVFRPLYCTFSCTMAWYLFKDADFWPSYVGGHGSTERCWDLSGTLALAKNLDNDFDHLNTVLRRFFLVQASYHLHSGAFHVFSVLLLHYLKRSSARESAETKATDVKSAGKGLAGLFRSLVLPRAMLVHTLSLFFLSVSYVFSSLRRLGAIAMFALDMSSWSMHLLQTCLNAPDDSILSQAKVIRGVWALLVFPSFLYFRFFVWPLLGYSATVESEQWLSQLESTLVPGSAMWFRRTFQLWMVFWISYHVLHFKRLVFHPHVQRIMLSTSLDSDSQQKKGSKATSQ